MNAVLKFCAVMVLSLASYTVSAQAVHKAAKTVKNDAKAVGNKTAELASKGKATMTDQVYKDKVGPEGQRIYIDNHSRYYWIDKKGHRQYVTKDQLKDKVKD